ncbi:MAG: hypothetical protein ABJA60_00265 [Nitrosospira sp.]
MKDLNGKRTYWKVPAGSGRELRLLLTVALGRPMLEFRIGELSGDRWTSTPRGVAIDLGDAPAVAAALKRALSDAKRMNIIGQEPGFKLVKRSARWSRR